MKCPVCGEVGTLKIQYMYQYALENKVLRSGKISKAKPKKVDVGSEDWSAVYCENCMSFWSSTDYDDGYYLENGQIHFENEEQEEAAYGKEQQRCR